MNFIGSMQGQEILIELKYCERCGGLWLRPQGGLGVYCASCQVAISAKPDPGAAPPAQPRRGRRRARPPQPGALPAGHPLPGTRIHDLQGTAAPEVQL
jgi:uncharacterized Zn finger protein (UPF0148 family)